jgi:hypothetical protein
LDDELLSLVPTAIREMIVAEEIYEPSSQETEPPPEPFAQTAELESIEAPQPGDVPREGPSAAPSSPITTAVRINTNTPLPPNRIVYEAPPEQERKDREPAPPSPPLTLARRPAPLAESQDVLELEPSPAAPPPAKENPRVESEAVELASRSLSPAAPQLTQALAPPEPTPSVDAEAFAETAVAAAPPPASSAPLAALRRAVLDVAAAEKAPSIQVEQSPVGEAPLAADPAEGLRANVGLPSVPRSLCCAWRRVRRRRKRRSNRLRSPWKS